MAVISLAVPRCPLAPGIARRCVVGDLDQGLPDDLIVDTGLLVSELVTNSVMHSCAGNADITVNVYLSPGLLRLTVSDHGGGDATPHIAGLDENGTGGLGLLLVNRLSTAWGVKRGPGGLVTVWCDILIDNPDPLPDGTETL